MILSKDKKFKKLLKGFQFGGSGKTVDDGTVISENWLIESRTMTQEEFTQKIEKINNYIKQNYQQTKITNNKITKEKIYMAPLEEWEHWEPYYDIFMECFYKVEYR